MSDGKGERRGEGGMGAGVWGGGVKVQKYTSAIQCYRGEIFLQSQETIADSLLLGQSASGLNFYDDSGRSPLAD